MSNPRIEKGWYGFDLDGTIAHHEPGDPVDVIGAPIEPMIRMIKDLLEQNFRVKIMTARVWVPRDERWSAELANECGRQRLMIMDWCEKHIGKRLEVTCEKDPNMIYLYDDRAYNVIRNTGEFR